MSDYPRSLHSLIASGNIPVLLLMEGWFFLVRGQDLLFGNLACHWLRTTRTAKCCGMGAARGAIPAFFIFEETAHSVVISPALLRAGCGEAEALPGCRGSRGCWRELGPYVRRHPRDWSNMEQLRL